MNEEVRKAVEYMDSCIQTLPEGNQRDWHTIRAELTRLTEIADGVDPLVVRLHDVTEKLERAEKDARRHRAAIQLHKDEFPDEPLNGELTLWAELDDHLSEPRT